MNKINAFLHKLWENYSASNSQAGSIKALIEMTEAQVFNDHIALRTFDDPRVCLKKFILIFKQFGYKVKGEYHFPVKKLNAIHMEHSSASYPKIFVSELILSEFSKELQSKAKEALNHLHHHKHLEAEFVYSGRHWPIISYEDYVAIREESEYAAWLMCFGFCVNHFTVAVHRTKKFASIEQVNDFLKAHGFELNSSGGEVKGLPEQGLVQSSTLAERVLVEFSDHHEELIPFCYYEFAYRYELAGELFEGFIPGSADKIFESTDNLS